MTSDRTRISQALVHGFRVLQAFTAPQPALTLVQVADRAGLETATAFHLVQTLVVLGYIERISGTKQFRLTLKPLELGFHAIVQNLESFSSSRGIDKGSRELNSYSQSELLEKVEQDTLQRRRLGTIPPVARLADVSKVMGFDERPGTCGLGWHWA